MDHQFEVEEENLEPVSPSAQYLRCSELSLTIFGVLELEFPIDDSVAIPMVRDIFLPLNPRFSSIMVTNEKGVTRWKKMEVKVEEHVHFPIFSSDMSTDYYDERFTEYLSNLASEHLPESRPLWEIHILNYPTKHAAGNIIFKLHHSLGDGYSLMGALLSCLRRADEPSMPLTFPSRQTRDSTVAAGFFRSKVPNFLSGLAYTAHDIGCSIKSKFIEDDKTPIRSGEPGVEFRPIVTVTTMFSIHEIRQIKTRLKVTINDVLTGIITFGTRLYMEETCEKSGAAKSTVLVLLNTRALGGYKSVSEMVKPDAEMPWGNRFTFMQVPIPKLITESGDELHNNPLKFVQEASTMIKRQRNSAAVYLTAQFLNLLAKIRGPETTARYIHGTLTSTSMSISNMIGPIEPMTLPNGQPVKGLYFAVSGPPQSLAVTIVSYVDKLRVAMNVEKGFIDPNKLKSCIEYAFDTIYKAALDSPDLTTSSR